MNSSLPKILILVLLLFNSSCTFVYKKMAGIHNERSLSDAEQTDYLHKLGATSGHYFYADTSYLLKLFSYYPDTAQHHRIKNYYQPIQVQYYSKSEFIAFQMINCYAGGFPKLNWNENGRFDQYPPKEGVPPDSIVPFSRIASLVKPVGGTTNLTMAAGDTTTVLFYWCRWNFRESKRLHAYVLGNLQQSGKPYKILYVNTDRLMAGE